MGNLQNQSAYNSLEFGGIHFQLNRPIIVPNETVSGTVYLQIKQNYQAEDLIFRILGYEKNQFIENEGTGGEDSTSKIVYRHATRAFMNTQIKIYSWNGNGFITPGQYSFPFQFLLPFGLPGSLYFVDPKAYALISYELSAFLMPKVNIPLIQYTQITQVREVPRYSIQIGQANINSELKCCILGCISNGSLNMTTYFEKNAYAPEEVASIATDIDCSKASCDVHAAFKLTQTIELIAGTYSKELKFDVVSVDLGLILKGEKWMDGKRKFFSLKLPAQSLPNSNVFYSAAMLDMKKFQKRDSNMGIAPTANGTIVKSNFALNRYNINFSFKNFLNL